MSKVLVIAPHPDDEILGCGGTLLRYSERGYELAWLIVTAMDRKDGWTDKQILTRELEVEQVCQQLKISEKNLYKLNFPTTRLDTLPISDLIDKISRVFKDFQPEELFVPHKTDIHSDHRIVSDAVSACNKWFRAPSLRRVLAYETLSETNLNTGQKDRFIPNVYLNITHTLEGKLELMRIYASELEEFPFPRSEKTLRALATLRGSQSGFESAEAFELIYERKE